MVQICVHLKCSTRESRFTNRVQMNHAENGIVLTRYWDLCAMIGGVGKDGALAFGLQPGKVNCYQLS